jgi:hypothetical protein
LSEFRTNTDHAPAVSLWRDYDIEGERILMAEASSELEGPDLEKGCATDKLTDGEMFLG